MGRLLHHALNAGDPYPVMALLMVTAVFVIIFNLIADIAYGWLDPRVRLTDRRELAPSRASYRPRSGRRAVWRRRERR